VAAAGAQLCDIDQLKAQAEHNRHAREAESPRGGIIDEAIEALRRRVLERDISPIVRDLRSQGQPGRRVAQSSFLQRPRQAGRSPSRHIRRFASRS